MPSFDQATRLEARVSDRRLHLGLAREARLRVLLPVRSPDAVLELRGAGVDLAVPDSPVIVEITP